MEEGSGLPAGRRSKKPEWTRPGTERSGPEQMPGDQGGPPPPGAGPVRSQSPENTAKVCLEEAASQPVQGRGRGAAHWQGDRGVPSLPAPGTTHNPRALISSALRRRGLLGHVTEFNNGTLRGWGGGGGVKKWNF